MGLTHVPLPPPAEENSSSSSRSISVPCARCKVFDKICDESCVFTGVFPESEEKNFLLLHDVYGVEQVESILSDVEPSMRKAAATSLIFEAEARKSDPVFGITGMINELNCQINLLEIDLKVLQHKVGHNRGPHRRGDHQ